MLSLRGILDGSYGSSKSVNSLEDELLELFLVAFAVVWVEPKMVLCISTPIWLLCRPWRPTADHEAAGCPSRFLVETIDRSNGENMRRSRSKSWLCSILVVQKTPCYRNWPFVLQKILQNAHQLWDFRMFCPPPWVKKRDGGVIIFNTIGLSFLLAWTYLSPNGQNLEWVHYGWSCSF